MKQKILNLLLLVFVAAAAFCIKTDAAESTAENGVREVIASTGKERFAAEEEIELIDYGYCGNSSVVWGLTTDGILVIAGEGTMPDHITEMPENTFEGCKKLETVSMSDRVETIGAYAFLGCYSLKISAVPSHIKTIDRRTAGN